MYRARIADKLLKRKLAGKGAVLIQGPKWCGKTTTAEQSAKSVLYMDDPSTKDQNINMAGMNPRILLQGSTPRLIDEWQLAPKLWDTVRFEVDHRSNLGQFILTGSSVPPSTEDIFHTGTGRFSWLTMRTMSLFESNESTGDVSLRELFKNSQEVIGRNSMNIEQLAFLTCRGGWPLAIDMDCEIALDQANDYLDAVVNSDINRVDGVERNPIRVQRLMRSFARNQGGQAATTKIMNDIQENEGQKLSIDTVSSYINALKNIFVIEDMPAWNPNLRSATAIRSADTRYYVDPSIATASLGVTPNDLISDLETFGFMFETLCIRDLRVYADSLGGQVYHYRDKNGLECDAVVHLRNGDYGLIEIKLGGDKLINDGIKTLNELERKIDTTRMKEPSFKMILVGVGEYAYRHPEGAFIVPIGCLKD